MAGPIPAVPTPFRDDDSVDYEGLERNVDRLIRLGATGVIAAGCTGEFWTLSMRERREVARVAVRAVDGRGTVVMGVGGIAPDDVISQCEAASEAGADAALVLAPYFVRINEAETVAHFGRVAAASPLPVVLYNIPGNAGNPLTPEIADRLADLPNVAAIKESSGDWLNFHRTLLAVRGRIRVFCGPSSVFGVAAVAAGADGLMDCFPNVWDGALRIWSEAKAGRRERADALQATGLALTALFTSGGRSLYPATKAVMNHLGYPGGGTPRRPLLPLEGACLRELLEETDRLLGRTASGPAAA